MRRIISLSLVLMVLLCGCQPQEPETAEKPKELIIFNWEDYMDRDVLDDFEAEFGIKVKVEEYLGPDDMFANIQANPEHYDVIITYGLGIEEMGRLKLLSELNLSKIPNFRYISKNFRNPSYDPENRYSIPYLWGSTGLAIDTDFVPEDTDSWNVLWDERYKGKIFMLDETRESIVALQKYLNLSANTVDPDELKQVEQAAIKLKQNDVEFGDTFDNLEKLMNGEAQIIQVYSGDVPYTAGEKSNIMYILPKEGFEIWTDNFVISAHSKSREEAHELINFLLRPDINARNAEKYSYATPNKKAERYLSEELLGNPYIFLNEEALEKAEFITQVGETTAEYNRIFSLMK